MSDQRFDTGFFRGVVPAGWKMFYGIDSEGNITPKKLHIYKNAHTESDIFSKAGITVCFFAESEIYLSPKGFYENVSDLEPFSCGNFVWNGYTCTSFGYPYTMLETVCCGCVFQVMLLMKNGENELSLEDTDVQIILQNLSKTE